MALLIGGAIAAVGSVAGAGISAMGANSAAKTAADANKYAADLAQKRYDTTRADLMPYNQTGQTALPQFQPLYDQTATNLNNSFDLAQSHIPHNLTQAELLNNPGYLFQVQQGKQALDNSLAAQGKSGNSGTRYKSLLNFGTGLAASNWQQLFNNNQTTFSDYTGQFNNRLNQGNSLFSQLQGRASLGENAAAQTGSIGANLAGIQANQIAQAGANLGAGQLASTQDIAKGINAVGQYANNYLQSPAGRAAVSGSDSVGNGFSGPIFDGYTGSLGSNPAPVGSTAGMATAGFA